VDDLNLLISDIRKRALIKGQQFTLASGKTSDVYVDCKQVSLWGPSLEKISRLFFKKLSDRKIVPKIVAGVSVGGDPLVAGFLLEAQRLGIALEGMLIRKEAKDHGRSAGRRWEGRPPQAGADIWLLEDVISTGKSSLSAAEYLRNEGFALAGILAIVDREMGGTDTLAKGLNIPVLSLMKLSQITDT
jgi:orotate phosphoribosyltransferase